LEEKNSAPSLVDIFEPLSEEEIEQLNGQLSDVHLETNEIFYTPRDRSERLFVLWKGRVHIYRTTDGGREFTLATVEAGTVFGEMALTAQQMQEAYARPWRPPSTPLLLWPVSELRERGHVLCSPVPAVLARA
jgi:CRP-like cAMP-binding protein